jgi:hypothetical protein
MEFSSSFLFFLFWLQLAITFDGNAERTQVFLFLLWLFFFLLLLLLFFLLSFFGWGLGFWLFRLISEFFDLHNLDKIFAKLGTQLTTFLQALS